MIDGIYKGDYREAFATKNPSLFLRHIPDDFVPVSGDGQRTDAAGLRQFFPTRFENQVRLLAHNVTTEDVDVLPDGTVSAVVTLYTLEAFAKPGGGTYFVTAIGTYRDSWRERGGRWFEVRGTQLRNQTITAPRP